MSGAHHLRRGRRQHQHQTLDAICQLRICNISAPAAGRRWPRAAQSVPCRAPPSPQSCTGWRSTRHRIPAAQSQRCTWSEPGQKRFERTLTIFGSRSHAALLQVDMSKRRLRPTRSPGKGSEDLHSMWETELVSVTRRPVSLCWRVQGACAGSQQQGKGHAQSAEAVAAAGHQRSGSIELQRRTHDAADEWTVLEPVVVGSREPAAWSLGGDRISTRMKLNNVHYSVQWEVTCGRM